MLPSNPGVSMVHRHLCSQSGSAFLILLSKAIDIEGLSKVLGVALLFGASNNGNGLKPGTRNPPHHWG
jgi:hypothetical protein